MGSATGWRVATFSLAPTLLIVNKLIGFFTIPAVFESYCIFCVGVFVWPEKKTERWLENNLRPRRPSSVTNSFTKLNLSHLGFIDKTAF